MGKHMKKLIAPFIVTLVLIFYFAFFIAQVISSPLEGASTVLGILLPLSLIGVSIYVLIQRIGEIRSGDEDDLGQY